MIKLTKILQEIGDSTAKPYPFQVKSSPDQESDYAKITTYGFESEHFPYTVWLATFEGGDEVDQMTVVFFVNYDVHPEGDTVVTNKGELYRVMATVSSIISAELRRRPNVDTLRFSPSKKQGDDTSRENLYLKYISQAYPNAEISREANGSRNDDIIVKFK